MFFQMFLIQWDWSILHEGIINNNNTICTMICNTVNSFCCMIWRTHISFIYVVHYMIYDIQCNYVVHYKVQIYSLFNLLRSYIWNMCVCYTIWYYTLYVYMLIWYDCCYIWKKRLKKNKTNKLDFGTLWNYMLFICSTFVLERKQLSTEYSRLARSLLIHIYCFCNVQWFWI
jgi:hypothetical protein